MDKQYRILVVGGGGREHAIIKKLSESRHTAALFAAPGNAGIAGSAVCLPVKATDSDGIVRAVRENGIDLVFIAPDDPLMLGLADRLADEGIRAFGPRRAAAELEGSKVFSKGLMKKYGIPTAAYEVFDNPDAALDYIRGEGKYPTVIKADGLALGKGAIIAASQEEAEKALSDIMRDRVFGASGNRVVVEEFLTGAECTVLAFADGEHYLPMVSAQDHKRALDGDRGLNTGGMGAFSPSPRYTAELAARCEKEIFAPTVATMKAEGRPFSGVIYFQIMITSDGPKVIEYNARFGDPEAQVVLPRLKTDLVDIIDAVIDGKLDEITLEWREEAAACVVAASGGYPVKYATGYPIHGLEEFDGRDDMTVYHAGTRLENGTVVTSGGRVLCVTAFGDTVSDAAANAYRGLRKISFRDMHFRTDIGKSADR